MKILNIREVKFYEGEEATKMLNLIIKLNGFRKIEEDYSYSLKTVDLYNPETKESKHIIVDDTEYQYGEGNINRDFTLDELELLRTMDIDEEALKQYNKDNDVIDIGSIIEVVKGRKYTKGTIGTVIKIVEYRDRYKRYVTDYLFTDNGMKIDCRNVKRIG